MKMTFLAQMMTTKSALRMGLYIKECRGQNVLVGGPQASTRTTTIRGFIKKIRR